MWPIEWHHCQTANVLECLSDPKAFRVTQAFKDIGTPRQNQLCMFKSELSGKFSAQFAI